METRHRELEELALELDVVVSGRKGKHLHKRAVRDLLRHLRGPVILVWDNGNNHKGPPIQKLLADYPRLTIERLPPYAPDLNPVEQLWQHLKVGHLANYAAPDIQTLDDKALDFLATAKFDRERLLSCFKNTPLYKPLTGHRLPGSQ